MTRIQPRARAAQPGDPLGEGPASLVDAAIDLAKLAVAGQAAPLRGKPAARVFLGRGNVAVFGDPCRHGSRAHSGNPRLAAGAYLQPGNRAGRESDEDRLVGDRWGPATPGSGREALDLYALETVGVIDQRRCWRDQTQGKLRASGVVARSVPCGCLGAHSPAGNQ